jgi:hypothetical protein
MKNWELQKSEVKPMIGQEELYDILEPFDDIVKDNKLRWIIVAQGVEKGYAELIVKAVNFYNAYKIKKIFGLVK